MVSPHHLASATGAEVLRTGGNALDAAIAANLMLSVVTPYHCGPGGDLFALIWQGDRAVGYRSAGRSPAGATRDAVARLVGDSMPWRGVNTVTVPGAVRGWFDLLERSGTRSFGYLASAAVARATDGFVPSEEGIAHIRAGSEHADDAWWSIYGDVSVGRPLRQPGLARLLETVSEHGPDAFYRGSISEAIVGRLEQDGGLLTGEDLAAHAGVWLEPLSGTFRGVQVLEHPPPTQGITALEALAIVDGMDLPGDTGTRIHLLVEAMRAALADRDRYVSDPDAMRLPADRLLDPVRVAARRAVISADRTGEVTHGLAGPGDTAYLCAADEDGMLVSLIQSNYSGFGSGITVPGWGLNLHNRGASFSLDRDHVNVLAPRKLPRHTLIPAMVMRDGQPWIVFGTMGGDGQAQTHLQLLDRLTTGVAVQEAISAPRWFVSPVDATVAVEDRIGRPAIEGLRERGHPLEVLGSYEHLMGHAHAIVVTDDGYVAGTDPRTEGSVA